MVRCRGLEGPQRPAREVTKGVEAAAMAWPCPSTSTTSMLPFFLKCAPNGAASVAEVPPFSLLFHGPTSYVFERKDRNGKAEEAHQWGCAAAGLKEKTVGQVCFAWHVRFTCG